MSLKTLIQPSVSFDDESAPQSVAGESLVETIPMKDAQLYGFILFSSAILLLLSFVVISLFLNHIKIQESADVAPTRRVQDLVSLLTQAEAKQQSLSTEVVKLRQHLLEIQTSGTQVSASQASKDPEYQKLLRMAGLAEIKGAGIEVLLQDLSQPSPTEKKHKKAVQESHNEVQSEDILKLINDLKAAGAKAISINGQRIVTTTEIVNAGPAILVNQTRITSPIVIRALGNAATLKASLSIRGGILEYLQFFGIQTQIKEESHLVIPAYTGRL